MPLTVKVTETMRRTRRVSSCTSSWRRQKKKIRWLAPLLEEQVGDGGWWSITVTWSWCWTKWLCLGRIWWGNESWGRKLMMEGVRSVDEVMKRSIRMRRGRLRCWWWWWWSFISCSHHPTPPPPPHPTGAPSPSPSPLPWTALPRWLPVYVMTSDVYERGRRDLSPLLPPSERSLFLPRDLFTAQSRLTSPASGQRAKVRDGTWKWLRRQRPKLVRRLES